MTGPLQGFRVVDLTSMVSGPYATQLLADQGADVVKVEAPSGDLMRLAGPARGGVSAAFLTNNRGKRSIVLDLKQPPAMSILRTLIASADAFVQNFRPGAAERMGIGEDAVRAIKPDIVYASISGFGEQGPYTSKRVYDPVIQALSGVMAIQGGPESPRYMRTILPDKLTAMTVAQAITAALLARERTGQGDHVKVAMLDATVAWMWPDGMINHTLVGAGASAPLSMDAYDSAFATKDGHIVAFAASDDEWRGLTRALDRPALAEDPRFKTLAERAANFPALFDLMHEAFRERTSAEWLARLDAEQVPCAAVQSVEDLFTDPQIAINELIVAGEHPAAGATRQPRAAARFASHALGEGRPAPMLGEHTEELLRELGVEDVEGLRQRGAVA